MIEGLYELLVIVIGRYFFGVIGASIRFVWQRVKGAPVSFAEVWGTSSKQDSEIDQEGFKSRMVGLFTIVALVVLMKAC